MEDIQQIKTIISRLITDIQGMRARIDKLESEVERLKNKPMMDRSIQHVEDYERFCIEGLGGKKTKSKKK